MTLSGFLTQVNDLNEVPIRIAEVARPRAVAVGSGRGVERHASVLKESGPPIHVVRHRNNES
jgi:hypothetical protein